MTSLIHIGDFHAAPGDRNPARYRALDQIIGEAETLPHLGGWLWPGDLNHGRMSIEDRNLLAQRLQRMAARGPVVLCYGNHDQPGDLEVFGRLKAGFPIYVIDRPETLRIRLATGENVSVFVLPYPTKAGLTALGVAPADVLDTAAVALDAIFMQAAGELDAARAAGDLVLAMGHVNVGGAIISNGQPNIGREIELSARHLDRLGDVPKLLNHIHVAQEVAGAWYAGSVCRLSWGEIEAKSYTVALFHNDTWALARRPLDVAPMYHVEGELTRDAFTWQVTAGPGGAQQDAPDTWKGCEVRVRYRYRQAEHTVLTQARVLAEFAEAARLEVEAIAVKDHDVRAPQVAAAATLPDKLRAYADVTGTVASVGLLDKLARLERTDQDALLEEVAAELNALLDIDQTATVAA
jgi:hypothetical protein